MKVEKHTITTLEFDEAEDTALSFARHLLDAVEDYLFKSDDIIVNTNTGEVIEQSEVEIARNLLNVLINDHCPTSWERRD